MSIFFLIFIYFLNVSLRWIAGSGIPRQMYVHLFSSFFIYFLNVSLRWKAGPGIPSQMYVYLFSIFLFIHFLNGSLSDGTQDQGSQTGCTFYLFHLSFYLTCYPNTNSSWWRLHEQSQRDVARVQRRWWQQSKIRRWVY